MGTVTLTPAAIRSLDIGDRLTKLRIGGVLVVLRNAGALTFTEDDALEGLHPTDSDTDSISVGAEDDAPAMADAVRALVAVGYPGSDARASIRAAVAACGHNASVEDLAGYALRNRVRAYDNPQATVVGVQVNPGRIVSAVVHDSLTITLASGRRLAWKAKPETMTEHGLKRLKVWPQEVCRFYEMNGEKFVNCPACGGWRPVTQCTHGEMQ